MVIKVSDDWSGVAAGTTIGGQTPNNARGGNITSAWQFSHTTSTWRVRKAATGNLLEPISDSGPNYGGASVNLGEFNGEFRVYVALNGDKDGIEILGSAVAATTSSFDSNGFIARLATGHTSLLVQNGSTPTISKTVTPPSADFVFGLKITDYTIVGTIYNYPAMTVYDSLTLNLAVGATRPRGMYWGARYGAAASPINSKLGWMEGYSLGTGAAGPVISSVNVVKDPADPKKSANGTITSAGTNGVVFYRWFVAADTPTEALVYGGTMANWTGGPIVVNKPDFPSGSVVRLGVIRRDSDYNTGAMVLSSAVTLDPALAAPTGTVSTVKDGQRVTVTVSYTGTVSSIELNIPVADPANGAIAQGPVVGMPASSPYVFAAIDLPPGSYAGEIVKLTNVDNVVTLPAGTPYTIEAISGTPESPVFQSNYLPEVSVGAGLNFAGFNWYFNTRRRMAQ